MIICASNPSTRTRTATLLSTDATEYYVKGKDDDDLCGFYLGSYPLISFPSIKLVK